MSEMEADASGPHTCEYLQPDLGQSRQRGLVEDTDVADLLDLRRVHTLTPNRPENIPDRCRLLKCALQEVWHGEEKECVSRRSAICPVSLCEEHFNKVPDLQPGLDSGAAAGTQVIALG